MLYRNLIAIAAILLAAVLLSSTDGSAASIKERMLDRLPAINALKDKGVIGENNQGLLEYRTANRPEQQLVNAENADRRSVYASIAKNQGVDAGLVGQRRARQIAERGGAGHWFQRPDGTWYRQ